MKNILLFVLALFLQSFSASAQVITTVAGDSSYLLISDNVLATTTTLYHPTGVAVDEVGNIYIADRDHNRIRKVNTSGIITTIAGAIVGISSAGFSGDNPPATAAQLNTPYCIALDAIGNIYIGDGGNYRIRKIDTAGIITTIAGNGTGGYNGDNIPATSAEFNGIGGLAIDKYNNIYVTDGSNNRIRKINSSGIITTIVGNDTCGYQGDGGAAVNAKLCSPYGIAIDNWGNMYVSAEGYDNVRKIDTNGVISTIAGTDTLGYDGDNIAATAARLNQPLGVAVDGSGNVYISDTYNERVRKVDIDGIITTIAGTGVPDYNGDNIPANTANISYPVGLAVDRSGNVFITDGGNNRIRRVGWPEKIRALSAPAQIIVAYPNPSPGRFIVDVQSPIQGQVCFSVINTLGQKIKEISIPANQPTEIRLNVSPGAYFLQAVNSLASSTIKIVIQ